ncbi:MAG: leucine-rich repeat domain-containing protein [Bacteroides sp.]|nr:leucine-rich repeat domain-containing protein [Bacteroides sp.]
MLKKLTLSLLLGAALFTSLRAENVEVNGIHYITNTSNHTAQVTNYQYSNGFGSISATGNDTYYVGKIVVPSSITVNGVTYTVTSLGRYAFCESNITEIQLPNTLTEICDYAFHACMTLQSVGDMPALNSIGNLAFLSCSALMSVGDMPALNSIGRSTFENCSALISVGDMPALNSIGNEAFRGCSTLISVGDMPALNSIGNEAFRGCSALISVGDMPALSSISDRTFYDCAALQSVGDMPALNSIGSEAFGGCSALKSVGNMPALSSISDRTFYDCAALQSVGDMPALTFIDQEAFYSCDALQSVGDMPALTSINSRAFMGCDSLHSIGDMPKLKTIGDHAFYGCAIPEFNLPESVTNVSTKAFSNPALVHFAGTTPPTFDTTSFSTLICVPAGSESAYAKALPDMLATKILTHGTTDFDVTVSARENDSDVLNKVNEGFDHDMALNVLNLKVTGTINSYDIIVFRNKMLNLRKLDLSDATIVGSSYEYYSGCHTEDNIVGDNMFRELNITDIILPKNAISIGNYAFNECGNLQTIILSDSIQSIGSDALKKCYRLTKIDIPRSICSIGNSAFYGCSKLREVIFPKELTSHSATIGFGAFAYCSSLGSITLPIGISKIVNSSSPFNDRGAFADCHSLTEVILPPTLTDIPSYCFSSCSSLTTISMPSTIKSIGQQAFDGCSSLTEFRIPAGVNSIGVRAIPETVRDVYTYTIQPTSIGENTFASDTYLQATLHVPDTSEKLYYWDTQWSQFQSIVNFNEPYSYFYLDDKDLIEDPDTPRIKGETDEETGEKVNPDANLGKDSGLVVDGNDSQDLGNVDVEADGEGSGTTIKGGDSNTSESGGNINIDMLNVNIPIMANRWYFFAFPFDVPFENIKFNGQMVWRYYDGEWRAMHGSGSWKDFKGEALERGHGYIFQGSKNGTLTLSIPKVSFDAKDWIQELKQYVASNLQDANWNFIGNPFQSFYELADLGFDGPITWWNPNSNSYEALSPEDDDFSMYPFMAFFVQKPEGSEGVNFFSQFRETFNQKNDPNHRANARKRRAARRSHALSDRKLINLTVTDGTNSDRTRVVFNSNADAAYEVGTDASKFISTEAPQIYSLDASNVRYAINERPDGDGVVNLGFYAPADGAFTIECTRTDCELTLKDCQSGKIITLTPGTTYEFTAKKGYDDSRFVLNAKGTDVTGIDAVESDSDATYYRINGLETDGSQRGLMIEVKNGEAVKVVR